MECNSKEYDKIAEEIFAPIYPDIAEAILDRTGVRKGRLLDAGCGGGHLGLALMKQGDFTLHMTDISEDGLRIARKRAEEQKVEAEYIRSDISCLPFLEESFDLVVSRGSMPFWEEQVKAFEEIYRVLKPGGWAYIGGGLGGEKHQERIFKFMKERQIEPVCFDRSKSKALTTEEYINLFEKWKAPWKVIENHGEGRWFIFGKRETDEQ